MLRRGYYTVVIDNGTSLDGTENHDSSLAEAEAASPALASMAKS